MFYVVLQRYLILRDIPAENKAFLMKAIFQAINVLISADLSCYGLRGLVAVKLIASRESNNMFENCRCSKAESCLWQMPRQF